MLPSDDVFLIYPSEEQPKRLSDRNNWREAKSEPHRSGFFGRAFGARKRKTVLCKFWESTGSCDRGSQCTYAHGAAELRHRDDGRRVQAPPQQVKELQMELKLKEMQLLQLEQQRQHEEERRQHAEERKCVSLRFPAAAHSFCPPPALL